MKFTIKDHKEDKEPEIELWLEGWETEIRLMGKDEGGDRLIIMTFRNGQFYRNISTGLQGLKTDKEGQIEEEV